MGEDSWARCFEFDSQHRIPDGHFFTLMSCKYCAVCLKGVLRWRIKKPKLKKEREMSLIVIRPLSIVMELFCRRRWKKVDLNIGSFFKKMGHSWTLFLYFCLFNTVDSKLWSIKILPMTGFKARTSGVGSNRSTNLATTTAQKVVTKGPLWYIQREKTKRTDIRNYYKVGYGQ